MTWDFEHFFPGRTKPKGSMRIGHDKRGTALIFHDTKNLKKYQSELTRALAVFFPSQPFESGVKLEIVFTLLRPASVPIKKRPYPSIKPDIDKLLRTILDASTGILYRDDCQVVSLNSDKIYCSEESEQGVLIRAKGLLPPLDLSNFK